MKLSKENIQNVTKEPGIYLITNTTNGKHYVGQAIDLRKRLLQHLCTINGKSRSQHICLYRAVEKHGIENFEFKILRTISNYENYPRETLKKGLDKLEMYYIEKYDSYNNGYNQTLGGDGGVLGYKMTEEQKDKIRENAKRQATDGRYAVYCLNIETKEIIKSVNMPELAKTLNVSYDTVRKAKSQKKLINKLYYISTNENILEEYESTTVGNITPKNTSNLIDYYNHIISLNKIVSIKELTEIFNVTRDTILKRNRKLREMGYELPIDSHNKIDHIEIRSIKTGEVIKASILEVAQMFGISERAARKQVARTNLYRKEYYFTIVYERKTKPINIIIK